jgi:hypothetical protein
MESNRFEADGPIALPTTSNVLYIPNSVVTPVSLRALLGLVKDPAGKLLVTRLIFCTPAGELSAEDDLPQTFQYLVITLTNR